MGTVTINLAGLVGNTGSGLVTAGTGKEKDGQVKNGSIFAGNINNISNDRIEQKRESARKQATKAIMDQFHTDSKVTDKIKELRGRNEEINQEIAELREQRKVFEEDQEALKGKYGITSDSEEQKELDLIRKAKSAFKDGRLGDLTKEELEQVAGIDPSQLTEYQKRSLQYDSIMSDMFDTPIAELERERMVNGSVAGSLKQGLLETSYKGISKAYKVADTIMEAASKEIIGMMWEDAKEHVDEEMQELVEAAKEKAEEKEEEEEKLEAVKEEKDEQKELAEQIQESTADQERLQGEIDKILKDAELLEEDLKGLVVDGAV